MPWNVGVVLPELPARHRIDRMNHAQADGKIDHAVHCQGNRGRAVRAGQIPGPGQAQLADVDAVDLLQRAEVLLGVGAAIRGPVAAIEFVGELA
jgi:hypothetical protein